VLGLSGQSDVSNLRSTCAPNCQESQVDGARAQLIGADVSLGVGVVSLGVALWFFLHPNPAHTGGVEVRPDAEWRPGGGVAKIGVSF
jgi:hypothetical protein